MTDEERRRLIAELRDMMATPMLEEICERAADEIERLAKELEHTRRQLIMYGNARVIV